jgi:predicted PurR-regulated permease PerM
VKSGGSAQVKSATPITALEIGLLYIVYSVIENYLIVPKVYGQTMKLSRLVVLISILIGGQLAGIFGMILILPLVGSWRAIEKYWIEPCISKG